MSLKYLCPLPASIANLSPLVCPEHFGQITRIAFQRIGTPFPAAAGAAGDIDLLASWVALLSASDGTKIQAAPINENFVLPVSEAIEEGGDDNSTAFGQVLVVGSGQVKPTGRYRGLTGQILKQLKQFISESAIFGQLGVYLFNEHGQIICSNLSGTEHGPIPITSYFISSIGSEGFNTHNMVNFQWSMLSNWSDDIKIVTPVDFNPNVAF